MLKKSYNQLIIAALPELPKQVRRMVDDFEWRIFPVMNPDGYAYSMSVDRLWKKNRSKLRPADKNGGSPFSNCSGVDLNRNFDTAEFCGK